MRIGSGVQSAPEIFGKRQNNSKTYAAENEAFSQTSVKVYLKTDAEMWSAGYNNGNGGKIFNDKSKNSFWERRIENKKRIENQVKKQQEKKRIQKKQAERTAYEEYAQNKRLSAQDARTRLVAESSSSAKTVTISQAVASYEANFTMAVSVSNKTQ